MRFCLCPLPRVLSWAITGKSLAPPSSWPCLALGSHKLDKCHSVWHMGPISSSILEAHPCHWPARPTWRNMESSQVLHISREEMWVLCFNGYLEHLGFHMRRGNQNACVPRKMQDKNHGIYGMHAKHTVYKEEIWIPILYHPKMIISVVIHTLSFNKIPKLTTSTFM